MFCLQLLYLHSLLPPSIILHLSPETPSPLQLVAKPDYPVAAGQRVDLHCKTFTMPDSAVWSWQRLENQIWTEVERGRDLTLTNPEQSGLYRCHAETNLSQKRVSPDHAVYIVSMHATGC